MGPQVDLYGGHCRSCRGSSKGLVPIVNRHHHQGTSKYGKDRYSEGTCQCRWGRGGGGGYRQKMEDHNDWVIRGVVHLPGRRHIITCSWDGSLRLWDLESGVQIGDDWRDEGDNTKVASIVLSPNGKTIASGSGNGTVKMWDVETGKVVAKWTGHSGDVWTLCWSGDGERVVSGSWDGTARVWDVKSGETVLVIKTAHENAKVYAVMYSPDNTKIATSGYRYTGVEIRDAKSGELLATLPHSTSVDSLAWMSNGKKLISASYMGSIRIFDTATWQQIAILEDTKSAITLFHNDRLLASTSRDKTVRLWNLDTNLPVGPPLQHDEGQVTCAAFSADGKGLVTCCTQGKAYLHWDIHAILKEAGLEDLLSDVAAAESLMDADATQTEGDQLLSNNFFNEHFQSSATRGTSHHHSSARRRLGAFVPSFGSPSALLSGLPSLFRRSQSTTDAATTLQQRPQRAISSGRSLVL